MYLSDLPGNGKSFQIRRDILRERNIEPEPTNVNYNRTVRNRQSSMNPPGLSFESLDSVCELVLIAGDISKPLIESKFEKIKVSRKRLQFLIIKIDYMEDLKRRSNLINDILFYLCYFRCFFINDEPFFLPSDLKVLIEIQTYFNNFLFESIHFLKILPRKRLNFNLDHLICSQIDRNCPMQTSCFLISQVVENKNTIQYSGYPVQNLFNRNNYPNQSETYPKILTLDKIKEIIDKYYIKNPNRTGEVTFSSLTLFCKMIAYEFKNLNSFPPLNLSINNLNTNIYKPETFELILNICVKSINPSVEAIHTQDNAIQNLTQIQTE